MNMEQRLTVKDVKSRTEDKEMDLSMMGISKVPVKEIVRVNLIKSNLTYCIYRVFFFAESSTRFPAFIFYPNLLIDTSISSHYYA